MSSLKKYIAAISQIGHVFLPLLMLCRWMILFLVLAGAALGLPLELTYFTVRDTLMGKGCVLLSYFLESCGPFDLSDHCISCIIIGGLND